MICIWYIVLEKSVYTIHCLLQLFRFIFNYEEDNLFKLWPFG